MPPLSTGDPSAHFVRMASTASFPWGDAPTVLPAPRPTAARLRPRRRATPSTSSRYRDSGGLNRCSGPSVAASHAVALPGGEELLKRPARGQEGTWGNRGSPTLLALE